MLRWMASHREDCEHSRSATVKQINVFPMLMLLIVVVLLIAWLGGYFA